MLQKPTSGITKPIISLYSFFYAAIMKGNGMKLKQNSKKTIKVPNQNKRLLK